MYDSLDISGGCAFAGMSSWPSENQFIPLKTAELEKLRICRGMWMRPSGCDWKLPVPRPIYFVMQVGVSGKEDIILKEKTIPLENSFIE